MQRTETVNHNEETLERNPRFIKVLMYHRIVDNEALARSNWTCVHVNDFRRQMRLLCQYGFTSITFDDYRMYLAHDITLPRRPVIITFDDGYLDTYQLAYPVLQEFGMKAVIFVLGDRAIRTNYWDQHLGMSETRLMNKDQILELDREGHEIGAHSTSHAKLTKVPEDRAWEEISRSKVLLEMTLGKSVSSFCYPYGMVNGAVKSMVRHSGYVIACSVDTGPAIFGEDNLEIRRMTIYNSTGMMTFGMRMLAPFEYYDWTRWKVVHTLNEIKGHNLPQPPKRIERHYTIGMR